MVETTKRDSVFTTMDTVDQNRSKCGHRLGVFCKKYNGTV